MNKKILASRQKVLSPTNPRSTISTYKGHWWDMLFGAKSYARPSSGRFLTPVYSASAPAEPTIKNKNVTPVNESSFSPADISLLKKEGIPLEDALQQLQQAKYGVQKLKPVDAVRKDNNYLIVDSEQHIDALASRYDEIEKIDRSIFFIPAAGAASRMHKVLQDTVALGGKDLKDCIENFTTAGKKSDAEKLQVMFNAIKTDTIAFTNDLRKAARKKHTKTWLAEVLKKEDVVTLFKFILNDMNYENLPKAVIPIHRYSATDVRTPLEEHVRFLMNLQGNDLQLHLAISEEHLSVMKKEIKQIKKKLRSEGIKVTLKVRYSYQDRNTNAIAYDITNDGPQKDPRTGTLVTRKAGHGALLKNINEKLGDVAGTWIRNIDNIKPTGFSPMIAKYKKAMRVRAFDLEQKAFFYLRAIEQGTFLVKNAKGKDLFTECLDFIINDLQFKVTRASFYGLSDAQKTKALFVLLNRPIVVAGYVPLPEGEKGGGGFVMNYMMELAGIRVKVSKATTAEGQELEGGQKNRFFAERATHFNPVDLYVTKKNYKGELFDLSQFSDHSRSMVDDKALYPNIRSRIWEHPGLWNGALALGFQVSMHVPLEAFQPTKELNDMLKKGHVPGASTSPGDSFEYISI